METFTTEEAAQLVGRTPRELDHLITRGFVSPAFEAPRRGMPRRFTLKNIVEIAIAFELLDDGGVSPDHARKAVRTMTNNEYWPRLCDRASRSDVAVLVLMRRAGAKTANVSSQLVPDVEVGRLCNTGYTVLAAVPVAYFLRRIEEQFPGASLS